MTVLKAADMHCEKRQERISKAMDKAELNYKVSLEDKTVTIDGCENCVAKARELMDDLGFDTEVVA